MKLDMKTKSTNIENDLMIRSARGEKVERTPVWVFRQAGRHLPEYNNYKKEKNKNFLELLNDPVDVAECTLQPIRRYNLDAAILFSDILVILQALGMEVTMPGGLGILVPQPLASPDEVSTRLPTSVNVKDKLSHVIQAVTLIKKELNNKVPLIGFSAAPWTLMYYMVGGSSKKNQGVASEWLRTHPKQSKVVMDLLTTIVIDYSLAQIEAGADMIQIFEAMGEFINESDFYTWALPSMEKIVSAIKAKHPDVPVLVFPRGASYSLSALQKVGYDVVTMDNKTDRKTIRTTLSSAPLYTPRGTPAGIQGNFNVHLLIPATKGQPTAAEVDKVKSEVLAMLNALGTQNLIANLDEGLSGKEDPVLVAAFIDSVHEHSERLIKAQASNSVLL